ncbi:beta-Ig-H3/fasciclin [Mucor ambiguus]|uniref:Beta-Ig-H3/fasciclin n=1 Tax=Mucor ambiguus TaxID=91626 RepID=A0A0C9N3H4_9FUNG|nr:beta-Ig-H3/fasciclin [Mucor ambiguus]
MQLSKLLSLVVLGAAAAVAQQQQQQPTGNSSATIVELLTAPNNTLGVSKFVSLLQSDPGYQPTINLLSQPGNYTCFVPNNRVISKMLMLWRAYARAHDLNATTYPPANLTIQNLTLADVVSYHVLNDKVQLANMSNYVNVAHSILNDTKVDLLGTGLPVLIENNATWSKFNNQTWLQSNGQYLQYEVGNGVDSADVRYHDLEASNGYVNVITSVLIPPMSPSTVIQEVDEVDSIATLLRTHPELATTLDGMKNFTFFAPNNRALKGVNFRKMDNATIKNIIMNHLVEGVYYSTNLTENATSTDGRFNLTTLNNGTLPVFVNGSSITLNDTARVVEPNIFFNNGVMHVISKLLNGTSTNTNSTGTNSTGTNTNTTTA